jgi:hypothetical protein
MGILTLFGSEQPALTRCPTAFGHRRGQARRRVSQLRLDTLETDGGRYRLRSSRGADQVVQPGLAVHLDCYAKPKSLAYVDAMCVATRIASEQLGDRSPQSATVPSGAMCHG